MSKGVQDMDPLKNLQFDEGGVPPEAVPYNKVATSVEGKHLAKVLRNAIEASHKYHDAETNYQKLISAISAIADLLDVE